MTDLTLYHNPRCSKSRGALELLEARGLTPTVVRYLETPLSAAQLRDQQPAYFREFITMCAEFGHRRNPGETLREMQRALKAIQFYHADFDQMTDYHYATRYADEPKNRSKEDGFLKSIREFRRQQKNQQS